MCRKDSTTLESSVKKLWQPEHLMLQVCTSMACQQTPTFRLGTWTCCIASPFALLHLLSCVLECLCYVTVANQSLKLLWHSCSWCRGKHVLQLFSLITFLSLQAWHTMRVIRLLSKMACAVRMEMTSKSFRTPQSWILCWHCKSRELLETSRTPGTAHSML